MGLKASGNTGERQQSAAVQRVLIIEIIGATFRRKGTGCGRNFKMVREDDRKRLKDGREAREKLVVPAKARLLAHLSTT